MNEIEFWKMQGCGNDFILIDNRDGRLREEELPALVLGACRRRESVGADGVVFMVPSERCDFAWRFFNADGGEAEMCGNAARCIARFAYLQGIAGPQMTFQTLAGPIRAEVNDRRVKIRMPQPSGLALNVALESRPGWESADFINTGVPHVVIGVSDAAAAAVQEQGREIRYHELFAPEGTNANFVQAAGPNRLVVRTYERGVEDETLACGTGAMAGALVAAARGWSESPVTVTTSGGEELVIHFSRDRERFEEVWLEGNTAIIYRAKMSAEALGL